VTPFPCQHTATYGNLLQLTATLCRLQWFHLLVTPFPCQRTATYGNLLQLTATLRRLQWFHFLVTPFPCQRTATYGNLRQLTAIYCNTPQVAGVAFPIDVFPVWPSDAATHCITLQRSATRHRSQRFQLRVSPLPCQHAATHCNSLQLTSTHCNSIHHTATHCNTPQVAAVSFPRDAFPAWLKSVVAKEDEGGGGGGARRGCLRDRWLRHERNES